MLRFDKRLLFDCNVAIGNDDLGGGGCDVRQSSARGYVLVDALIGDNFYFWLGKRDAFRGRPSLLRSEPRGASARYFVVRPRAEVHARSRIDISCKRAKVWTVWTFSLINSGFTVFDCSCHGVVRNN